MTKTKLIVGVNDVATLYPELIPEFDEEMNGDLRLTDVTAGCDKSVWWKLPYDDPKTGRHFDFKWSDKIYRRINRKGCPYLSKPGKVWKGFNDLETYCRENHREYLLNEWDNEKNVGTKLTDYTTKSQKRV